VTSLLGGCDDPDCAVPLCWMHQRAYDTGRLELLPHLEPRWRREVAHALLRSRPVGAWYRRGVRGSGEMLSARVESAHP